MSKVTFKQLLKNEYDDWSGIAKTIANKLKDDVDDFRKFIWN